MRIAFLISQRSSVQAVQKFVDEVALQKKREDSSEDAEIIICTRSITRVWPRVTILQEEAAATFEAASLIGFSSACCKETKKIDRQSRRCCSQHLLLYGDRLDRNKLSAASEVSKKRASTIGTLERVSFASPSYSSLAIFVYGRCAPTSPYHLIHKSTR